MIQRKRCSGSSRWCSSSRRRSGHDGIIRSRLFITLLLTLLSLLSICITAKSAHGGGAGTSCAFFSSTAARRGVAMTGTTTRHRITRFPPQQSASFLSTSSSSSSSSKMKNEEGNHQSPNSNKKYSIKTNKNNFSKGSSKNEVENDAKAVMNTNNTTNAPAVLLSARIESFCERCTGSNGNSIIQVECDKLLADCIAANEWDAVLDVLDIYQQHVIMASSGPENKDHHHLHSTYRACLQACFEASNAAYAVEILQVMKKNAHVQPDGTDIGLVVVTMCRKQRQERGWWRQALKLVQSTHLQNNQHLLLDKNDGEQHQQTQHLSVEVYDAVLACMVEERQWQPAVRLLREMELNSPVPLPPQDSRAAENDQPQQQQQQQQGVAPALSTYRTVIECCVASRQPEQAVQVLQSCARRGLTPTVYAFELVIGSLCNTNNKNSNDKNNDNRNAAASAPQWRRAMQIMNLMDRLQVDKTLDIYNNVLAATAKAKAASQAKNLLWQMKKQNVKPNIVSFNSVICACASSERWKDALTILDQCHREPGVQPDIYTYTNVMRACAKGGQYRRALSLLQVVKDKKLPLDAYAYTAVIEACAKSSMWQKALELFNEMQQRGIAPTKVTYSVTINALGNGGQYEKALALLETMRSENLSPNLITYNSAITAISKAAKQAARQNDQNDLSSSSMNDGGEREELWKKALQILDQMRADGIEPDGFSFSAAIACCGSQGRWEEALELLEAMERGGPRTRPNRVSYTAAIASCGRAGQVDHALRLFRRMKDEGLSADRVAYNSVFSALRVAKRGELAVELWEEMLGTKQTIATKIATGRAEYRTPDIITVTDAIGAITSMKDYGRQQQEAVDNIFAQAVSRGILLRADFLESTWKVDLHGLSLPVSRAACRYIFQQVLDAARAGKTVQDLTLGTGIGAGKGLPAMSRRQSNSKGDGDDVIPSPTSLRQYIQHDVLRDFVPPIESSIPSAAGTVLIKREALASWIKHQEYR